MHDVRRIGGKRGLRRGPGKRVDGMLPGRPQSVRDQRRPVEDGSPGLGRVEKDGGTRGGTFNGKMDRCRESQDWTTACSSMPERDEKDQGDDSSKEAGSCWFAHHSRLATSGANLYPPGVWFADVMSSFSDVTFVTVLFRFRLFAFTEAAAFRSIVLRSSICMRPYSHTQLPDTCLCPFFGGLSRCRLFRVFLYPYTFSLFMGSTSAFFPSGWCFTTL